jgi:anti-anti-sigma factor
MEIKEDRRDGVVIIALAGRVDSTTAPALEAHLGRLDAAAARRLVVDFSGVEYISSAGLRVMLMLAKRVREQRGALAICGLGDSVRQVFALAGFLPLFVVKPSQSAAVAAVTGL